MIQVVLTIGLLGVTLNKSDELEERRPELEAGKTYRLALFFWYF